MKSRTLAAAALVLLLPLLFPAAPAQAQSATCRWNLDGEWVGQSTGNRVMIEMRAGGFVSWVSGSPKPGQTDQNGLFKDVRQGEWQVTFANGNKTFARIEGNGLLRLRNPDGWTDLFKPMTPHPCATVAANTAPRATPAVSKAIPVHAPAALIRSITEPDLHALLIAEGHTVDEIHPYDAPSVRGKTKDGHKFVLIGTACDKDGIPGCRGIMMQVRYDADDRVTLEGLNNANVKQAALSSWWDKTEKTVGFTRYVVLDDGVTWMNIKQNLRVLLDVEVEAALQVWPE